MPWPIRGATALRDPAPSTHVLPLVGRVGDWFVSRGTGANATEDPFAPPLTPIEVDDILDQIRAAPAASSLPFQSPLPPPGGSALVEVRTFGTKPPWAIVAPHYGSLEDSGRIGITGGFVHALRRGGYSVALIALPYHSSRRVPNQLSGWGFVRADLGATARAIGSAAAEITSLARRLEPEIGIGLSLGGAGLGLAAALGAPFARLAFVAAVDNPGSFYATGANRENRRKTLLANGFGAAQTIGAFERIAPSSFPAPAARSVFAIPTFDGVVPTQAQVAWANAWGGTQLELSGHGHATALASPRVATRVVEALA